jgi:hypothetical protein
VANRPRLLGDVQYDLAPYVTRLAELLGKSCFRKRQDGLDNHSDGAGINELSDLAQLSRICLALDMTALTPCFAASSLDGG